MICHERQTEITLYLEVFMGSAAGAIFKPVAKALTGSIGAVGVPRLQNEQNRQTHNKSIYSFVENLQGNISNFSEVNPGFDFESIKLAGASAAEENKLSGLINLFQRRQKQVLDARTAPGIAQTRLSLLE